MPNAGKKIDRLGPNQQKVLLLLLGGAGLSVARTSKQYFRVIAEVKKEWEKINQRALNNALRNLYKSKLVAARDNPDGSVTMVLTDKGRKRAITFNIETMRVKKPKYWDKKWRLVLFDIPERRKGAREALRSALRRLGFCEYQKSVFICPYPCQNEIDYVIEFFDVRPHVRLVTAISLDNELHFRKIFDLL